MPIELPALAHAELVSRLALSPTGRTTVLTPNPRLAQALVAAVDRVHLAAGRAAWEAPDVLPVAAFLQRIHDEALHAPSGAALPALLTTAQALVLWEEALRASRWHERMLSVAATAALAAEAWELAHAWHLEDAVGAGGATEESEAFAGWCAHYRRRTQREGCIDAARLPRLAGELLAERVVEAPTELVLHGFDLVTPQLQDFLAACERSGVALARCEAPRADGDVRRVELDSPRQELEWAARWARARLEAADGPSPRIAIVVPGLEQRRSEAWRVFSRVLAPASRSPRADAALFNISLGEPLADFALVDGALALLDAAFGTLSFDRASRLLRSPFLAGSRAEAGERARLDVALRRSAPATLTLTRLRALAGEATSRGRAPACPRLVALLDRLIEGARESARAPAHDWARRFSTLLEAAGFPGEHALDSTEFQALAKWREALAELATLGAVAGAWSASEARTRLRRLCTDTVFQPASGGAPVQVLGVLESAGLAFDHLWVSGLTEDAWPLPARAHPLIAPALQRAAGIPQASAERSLELDAALTAAWRVSAPEVLFTSARADGDRELLPSPLIASIAETPRAALGIPEYPSRRAALFAAARAPGAVAMRAEPAAPPLALPSMPGGTAVLADQAACPFRAFVHFRLGAHALETPQPGLGAPERGQLLHALMARIWGALGDHATLVATPPARLDEIIDEAAAHAVARMRADRPGRLEERFAQLERERLARIAREWLGIERDRAPFTVTMREETIPLRAGSLHLEGRVDRVDRLHDGGLAVIDYKSGPVRVSCWLGERPDDAQLPLYALAAGTDEVRALAFARLKIGERGFVGLAREEGVLPEVATVESDRSAKKFAGSWSELLARWRAEIDRLGESFARGEARVDPKTPPATCARCDLQTLCRVHERFGGLGEDPEAEADE